MEAVSQELVSLGAVPMEYHVPLRVLTESGVDNDLQPTCSQHLGHCTETVWGVLKFQATGGPGYLKSAKWLWTVAVDVSVTGCCQQLQCYCMLQ